MSVRLVSTNDHPVEYQIDWANREFHPAESLQLNEQEEANEIADLFAFGFACFGGGCLVTAALFLIGRFL